MLRSSGRNNGVEAVGEIQNGSITTSTVQSQRLYETAMRRSMITRSEKHQVGNGISTNQLPCDLTQEPTV
jgi:hypothetical protein